MFKKILIANRGEIAVRIAKTLQEMGIRAGMVYADSDRESPHIQYADEAYHLNGTNPAETYLNGKQIIEIARKHGIEAIHPGYGFLSENPDFAEACEKANIIFIGPSASAIRLLGDKLSAKAIAKKAGAPLLPSWAGQAEEVQKAAQKIGYPLLLKAAAGGGGKGMRLAQDEAALPAAFEAASREAAVAFGDPRIFLEKVIPRPRHIEFQIFGDSRGQVVHLFERECSIQRRYQKIVEESPSAALPEKLRQKMGEAAVAIAQAAHYTNAGTVEFLVDASGNYYFLEINTRLQVEHPVTEMIIRHDLVAAQIKVAAGEPLPFAQKDLKPDGHAMECRVYAEDPKTGFLPSAGKVIRVVAPSAPFLRIDSGIAEGAAISTDYDPLLAKIIAWGRTRNDAIHKMQWALRHFVILGSEGLKTNVEFLQGLLVHPKFVSGEIHTRFLEEHPIQFDALADLDSATQAAMFLAVREKEPAAPENPQSPASSWNPWKRLDNWRAF